MTARAGQTHPDGGDHAERRSDDGAHWLRYARSVTVVFPHPWG
jgi:hypothetical protein